MAGFWTALKNIFTGGGGGSAAPKSAPAPAPSGDPERFCIFCMAILPGTITPTETGVIFTCHTCSKDTQLLA